LFRGDKVFYLPRNEVVEINEPIEQPENTVLPSDILDHFIRQSKYHYIMNRCICRDGCDCKKYAHDLGCLFLGEATLKMGPEIGRMVTADEALDHARKCREAGLIHMVGRNRLDAVIWDVDPPEKFLTVCNCCECCCLWRILPDIPGRISSKISKVPGVTVSVNIDECTGCGECTNDHCFVNAISMADDHPVINNEVCRGCGRCALACPTEAIKVSFTDQDYVNKTIKSISKRVDLT
jgi:ferredoxin